MYCELQAQRQSPGHLSAQQNLHGALLRHCLVVSKVLWIVKTMGFNEFPLTNGKFQTHESACLHCGHKLGKKGDYELIAWHSGRGQNFSLDHHFQQESHSPRQAPKNIQSHT